MQEPIDLFSLSKEQLVSLVQARGQAVQFGAEADQTLYEVAAAGNLDGTKFQQFMTAKNDIVAGLATAEEQILAGHTSSPPLN